MRERLKKGGVELNVVYGPPNRKEVLREDEGILPWGIKRPCRNFNIDNLELVYQHIPSALLIKQDLIVIPHENRFLFNYFLLARHRFGGPRIAFFGHGANFQARQPDSYREKLKSLTAREADWWFAYTSLSVEKVLESGFPEDRITCVNNTVNVNKLIEWQKSVTTDELYALRKALGLQGNNIGIFVGSLYKDKRLEFLFSAADKLRKRLPDFELIIIGDGPRHKEVDIFVRSRQWACWVGAKHVREKVLHILLGKVMLNPGLVGLGILDSFALGIPMITTDCKIHSPEIAYLESGRNGIMTPDNVELYVDSVVSLLKDDQLRNKIASACIEDSHRYSLENMVNNFCDGILTALNQKPPPTRCK